MHTFEHMRLHPERPQIRQIRHAAALLRDGLFAVVPTETTYALMVLPAANKAQESILKLRNLDHSHLWSLVVSDLSQAAQFVSIDNNAHRILKHYLPGPFTFILPANSKLPKRIFGKRRDVGIRMPDNPVCKMLLEELGEPLLGTSMQFPAEDVIAMDPDDIADQLKHLNAIVLDTGWGGLQPTTVVDLCDNDIQVIRQGAGEWA